MPNFIFMILIEARDQDHAEERLGVYLPRAEGIRIVDCQEVLARPPYAGRHHIPPADIQRLLLTAEEAMTE